MYKQTFYLIELKLQLYHLSFSKYCMRWMRPPWWYNGAFIQTAIHVLCSVSNQLCGPAIDACWFLHGAQNAALLIALLMTVCRPWGYNATLLQVFNHWLFTQSILVCRIVVWSVDKYGFREQRSSSEECEARLMDPETELKRFPNWRESMWIVWLPITSQLSRHNHARTLTLSLYVSLIVTNSRHHKHNTTIQVLHLISHTCYSCMMTVWWILDYSDKGYIIEEISLNFEIKRLCELIMQWNNSIEHCS